MTETDTSLISSFTRQRRAQGDDVLEQAQKLVNLYRCLSVLPKGFSQQLDEMLLAASPEVQTALSDIVGGSIVRQYLDYLKDKTNPHTDHQTEQKPEASVYPTGYLPTPDADIPISSDAVAEKHTTGTEKTNVAALENLFKSFLVSHQEEMEKILNAQTRTLVQLMQRLDQQAQHTAHEQTDRLADLIKEKTAKQYSDVIETAAGTPPAVPFVSDDGEGF